MGVAGDILLAVAGVVAVVAAPLEAATAVLIGFWLLVPGTLVVPHAAHLLVVDRVILYALAFRLLARSTRPGEPGGAAYALTPVHAALTLFLVVGYLNGVVLAPSPASLANDLHDWLFQFDLAVLFVVVLAVARTLGPWRIVRAVSVGLAVAVVIGFVERFTGHGWSHFFFEGVPANDQSAGVDLLTARGGAHRAQGAAQFALEYGWVLAMLLPMAVFFAVNVARRQRRTASPAAVRLWPARLALLLPVGVVCAVIFSVSRSAEVATGVGVLLLLFSAFDRRLLGWVAVAGVAALIAVLIDSSFFTSAFSTVSDPASVRLDRLPALFSLVVHRPFTGVGFTGISINFGGLDNSFALMYAQTGVSGLISWAAVVITSIAATTRTLRAPRGSDVRMLGAACLIGIAGVVAAAATYDLTSILQSSWALMVLAAVGVATAESVTVSAPRARRRWLARAVAPLAGVGTGFVVLALAPVSASESLSILTVAPWVVADGGVGSYQGMALTNTLCGAVTNADTMAPGTSVTCIQGTSLYPEDYTALALVSVRAHTPSAVTAELKRSFTPIFHYLPIAGGATGTIQSGKPAWATTAPLWLGATGLAAVLIAPPLPRWRRTTRRAGARVSDEP